MRWLSRIPARHKAWAVAKLVTVSWFVVYLFTAPAETHATLGGFLLLFMLAAVAGGAVSIVGMIISHAPRYGHRVGLTVELAGLYVLCAGPFAHAVTMVAIMIGTGLDTRSGPMLQSLAILAFVIVRIIEVRRPWSRMTAPTLDPTGES